MTIPVTSSRAERWISAVWMAWVIAGIAGAIYYGFTR